MISNTTNCKLNEYNIQFQTKRVAVADELLPHN
jgi:hypothetical protein